MRIKNTLMDWVSITLALYAAVLSSQVLSNPPEFLWLPLSDLREKERVLVTFTYSHRDEIKHDCSGNICDSQRVAVEEKTGFCRFREVGSQSFQPGPAEKLPLRALTADGSLAKPSPPTALTMRLKY